MKVKGIYDDLRQKILGGTFQKGDRLPTTAELSKAFGCSVGMVSKAISMLIHDGIVEQRRGLGTRVIKTQSVQLDAYAFIYPSEQHEGIRRIAQGFQEAARLAERRVVMVSVGMDFRKEGEIVGRLGEFDVRGAVVYPVLPKPEDRLYFAQMLTTCRFPVVLVDIALPGFCAHSVEVDGFHAAYTMTRHLLAQGLRCIGFLANGAWGSSVQNRYRGYRWALDEAGIEERPGWVLLEPSMQPDYERPVEMSNSLTNRYLEMSRGVDGIVCGDDFMALSCLDSARELGLRVPEDLRVVGIDNYEAAALSRPPLTTYQVPFHEMGGKAFQMLDRLVQGETFSTTQILVRGVISVRQSG